MKRDNLFFDTNILLYLLSEDRTKADLSERLVASGGVSSVQVMNEFASVASRKLCLGWIEIIDILSTVRRVLRIVPVTVEVHELALRWCKRYGFSVYDSAILAAAQIAGCRVVATEDLQHGQQVGNLRLLNPFT